MKIALGFALFVLLFFTSCTNAQNMDSNKNNSQQNNVFDNHTVQNPGNIENDNNNNSNEDTEDCIDYQKFKITNIKLTQDNFCDNFFVNNCFVLETLDIKVANLNNQQNISTLKIIKYTQQITGLNYIVSNNLEDQRINIGVLSENNVISFILNLHISNSTGMSSVLLSKNINENIQKNEDTILVKTIIPYFHNDIELGNFYLTIELIEII